MQLIAGNDLTLASAANESHHYSKIDILPQLKQGDSYY